MTTVKIIIQDNNVASANSLRTLLSQAGYSVVSIKTRKGLTGLILKFKPDLLFIERNVNDDETKKILAELKRNFNIKVIANNCHPGRSYLIDKIGFDDCLERPFDIEEIQDIIVRQLSA